MLSNRELKKRYKSEYKRLNAALKYKNKDLIARFMSDYQVDRKFAVQLFKDMVRFFWLGVMAERLDKTWWYKDDSASHAIPMYGGMALFDEMWHTFLLFTKDYEEFGKKFFGETIFHNPSPVDPPLKKGESKRSQSYIKRQQEPLMDFVDFVWATLGGAVANRWFIEYGTNYTVKLDKRIVRRSRK